MSRMTGFGALAVAMALVMSTAAGAVAAAPDRASATRPPLAMGVSNHQGYTATPEDDLASLDAFAAATGRMPGSWSIWSDWGGPNAPFPSRALLDGLTERGVRPVIFWQPTHPDVTIEPERYAYERVLAGDWDAYLTRWATDAAAWGEPIVVRYAHEMNAGWFPWSVDKNGNTPESFKAAWRHLVTLVRSIAPQVRFLWNPNAPCPAPCTPLADLYPGDAVVDLVGFDVYNGRTGRRRPMVATHGSGRATRPCMRHTRRSWASSGSTTTSSSRATVTGA